MGFRLLMLMAMGLGAMYMLHLLAMDFDRIRQPVQAASRAVASLGKASSTLFRGRRSADANARFMDQENGTEVRNLTTLVDWKRILSRDPFECLQSLICQIMSGAESNTKDAVNLMEFLEMTLAMAPAKIGRAFSLGLMFRGNTDRCYDEYPFCLYSANTMLRVLNWFCSTTATTTTNTNTSEEQQ